MAATQSELRLARLIDEREVVHRKHEDLLAAVEAREEGHKTLTDSESSQVTMYRERRVELDGEIAVLAEEIDANNKAVEESKKIRRVLAGNVDGIDADGDGVVYRTMAAYARDFILTRQSTVCSQIATQLGDSQEVERAKERIQLVKRTPANTLSSDVPGISVAQHIDQIFQVIDSTRPLVASAQRSALTRGVLTYPKIASRPVVAVQASEKTEAGNVKLQVDLETANASVYLGGGDLSWQAINWTTPDALDLWFRLAAADYALKTEQDAADVVQVSGLAHVIGSPLSSTPTFADFMTAVGKGAGEVYTDSGRMADTVYMAPDRYWYLFGTTSQAAAQFTTVSGNGVGPLRFVASRGLDSGVVIVGDSQGLLVAETPGAPVELRVVEPAIGGVEVGIIGAFEAVVVDDGAFSLITTAT